MLVVAMFRDKFCARFGAVVLVVVTIRGQFGPRFGEVWRNSLRNVDLVRLAKDSGGHAVMGILPTLYSL